MGFLTQLTMVAAPARLRAMTSSEYREAFWSGSELPALWPAGSADAALTLSYVYCAVSIISDDLGTMTCQMFENLGEDGKARVAYAAPGIGPLAYKLRWQPNSWQTAKGFWSTLAWQYLLRPAAYAEIVYRPGLNGYVEALIPRHPDRVTQQTLPSGALRFQLREPTGQSRYLTAMEMFVVRNTSMDGLNALGRLEYGGKTLETGLNLQEFTRQYFKHGATAALVANYKGEKDDEDEALLHKSITRYLSGPENAGGLLLIPEDVDVKAIGVDPEKAQLLGLKNISGRDVARLFKMPPSWLGIEDAQSYNSQLQDATNYINRVQMPLVVEFEQAIQRDLIMTRDRFFAKFNMDYLLRGDLLTRMQAYEIGVKSRILRPSEARIREDMNPDPALDRLSEGDFRPGTPKSGPAAPAASTRTGLKTTLVLHDQAVRCVRRERIAVEKLARKHASDVEAWQVALREFYSEHAGFVAQTMRMPLDRARAYAAEHGAALEANGIVLMTDHWEREEAEELCALSLGEEQEAA